MFFNVECISWTIKVLEFLSILGIFSAEVHRKLWSLKADHRTLNGQPYIFLPLYLITFSKLCIQSTQPPHIQCVPVLLSELSR